MVQHFHVNEGDLRQILELLSRRAGMNILVSPRVSGTVTVNFESVTVDQVLTAVIKLANLVEKTEGSIHYIYTKQELQDEAEEVKKERILTKVYKLNYVRSDEMMNMIRPFLSADVGLKRISITPTYRFGISESATFVSGGGTAIGGGGGRRRRWQAAARHGRRCRRRRCRHGSHGDSTADRRQLTLRPRPPHHPGL